MSTVDERTGGAVVSAARDRLRTRLAFVVQSIDAGRYREPADAADEVLDVVASIFPAHRADVLALLDETPLDGCRVVAPLPERLRWAADAVRKAGHDAAADAMLSALDALAHRERECEAWANGVADLVERFGYDRDAANGPADLLPGLVTASERLAGLEAALRNALSAWDLYGTRGVGLIFDDLRTAGGTP